ncbi:hypothetical protein LptCag_1747 [Leptospirillum ferriphilum]|uniref:Uncharacterized protein n=2 Tax=Leptospirillum ferriphilum TaxID=178606 RepID=A0A094W5A8_9BACT|nr:hypothetical protein LFML04_1757 [Leptospirillum ferriphilum ML-04]KGA92603.1 hypothetical protein LptCag_1747 [Leptospirillum ferriphilum]
MGTLGQTVAPRAVPDDTSSSTRVPSWRCFWARAASIFPGPTEGRPRHRRARLRWPRPHPGPLRAWKWPSRGTAPGKERDWRPVRSIGGRSGPPEGSAAGCVLNPGELSDPRQTRGAHHPDHGRHVPVGQGVDAGEIMRDHARSWDKTPTACPAMPALTTSRMWGERTRNWQPCRLFISSGNRLSRIPREEERSTRQREKEIYLSQQNSSLLPQLA